MGFFNMHSSYKQITQQYSRLKELVLDVNHILQEPENYAQFDPRIKDVILDSPNSNQAPSYIKQLPQVQLIKSLRESINLIANDFQADDYTKFFKILYHLQNFWAVAKSYMLAEDTLCLSPEFNSKMLSLINIIIQSNQIFRDELSNISTKPQFLFDTQKKDTHDDTRKWHYYHKKIIALLKLLPDENKLKPYIKNLERLVMFIINLKEQGILKSNIIVSVFDSIESFNNASRTSIKEILQEYAIFSEQEIHELLDRINHFWASFLPICDETEINMGLTMGYLTHRLKPVFNFCNLLEDEFNQGQREGSYPFTEIRLTRIRHGIKQTELLLSEQNQHKQKLNSFNNLIEEVLNNQDVDVNKIVSLHQFIELLNCDLSLKKDFHELVDKEVESRSNQLTPKQMDSLQFNQLLNKYKTHEASLEEAQLLFSKLQETDVEIPAQNYYLEMSNEYAEYSKNFTETLEKIEKGQLSNKDTKHLLVMINIFEILNTDAVEKSELVKTAVNKQIKNTEKLQEFLNLFEAGHLPEQDFYQLLCYVDLLDCDTSIKEKYKKQITDLDYKRKNSGYLRLAADFALGLFTEVTVPFSEISSFIQNKITSLNTVIEESTNPSLNSNSANKPNVLNSLANHILKPIASINKKIEWIKLKKRVKFELNENERQVESLQSIYAYQTERYKQLENSLNSYKPPEKKVDVIEPPTHIAPFSLKNYLSNLIKSVIANVISYISSFYSTAKSTWAYFKSLFSHKTSKTNIDEFEIIRKETNTHIKEQPIKRIETYPYKQLNFVEENISWFFEKLVNPIYYTSLKKALKNHQSIQLTEDMPYFYRQGAEIINIYILLRKVLLSYTHWDMLQLTLAVSNLNAENKVILKTILEDSTLTQSSHFYDKVIKPTLSDSYQIIANLKSEDNIETSLPQVIHTVHNAIASISKNQPLNLKPLLEFLKRVGDNLRKQEKPLNEDLSKLYCSINKLTQFVEKVLNHQQNLIVEVLFSLADLSHQFRQLSSSITGLLIKDQFPYVKELSVAMKNLQDILLLLQDNIKQFKDAGLNPTITNSLTNCVEGTNKLISQLTPIKFQQERILLEIGQIKSQMSKLSPNIILKNELDNIHQLLTTESDQKFINEKILDSIETRLNEIKMKINESHRHTWFGLFSKHIPFTNSKNINQNSYTHKQSNRIA